MQECQWSHIFTEFSSVPWSTLANIISWSGVWLEANPKFTFMILTWRSLWIHHCDYRRPFTEFAGMVFWTIANIVVYSINAGASVLWNRKIFCY
jgi:hypothetical protein